MRMRRLDSLKISPLAQIDSRPGGYHLMVFEPQRPLKSGQQLQLILYFNDGHRISAQAQVVSLAHQAANTGTKKQAVDR